MSTDKIHTMADPDRGVNGANPPGGWRRSCKQRWESTHLPEDVDIQKDFRRSRPTKRGPTTQHGQRETPGAHFQQQPRPQKRQNGFYLHQRVTTRWRHHTIDSESEEEAVRIQQDPQFQQKVGIIYKILKAKHHMNQVTKDTPPIFINNFTLMLGRKIKPAMISDFIKQEIWDNARKWQQSTLLSLKTHYNTVIKEQLDIFFNLPDDEWQRPFKTAIKWAKINMGKRLQKNTIIQTEKILTDRTVGTGSSTLQLMEVLKPTLETQPAVHSPATKGLLLSSVRIENKLSTMEKTMNELTCFLENFKRSTPPEKEQRRERLTAERTTQTGKSEPTICSAATQTDTPTTGHRRTQTRTTKRQMKGVAVQVPSPKRLTAETQTGTQHTFNRFAIPVKEKQQMGRNYKDWPVTSDSDNDWE